jgi:hypothetical protein
MAGDLEQLQTGKVIFANTLLICSLQKNILSLET